MCNEAVRNGSWLSFAPNQYKTQGMCNEIVHAMPKAFRWIPECFKTQDMCKKAAEKDPSMLQHVSSHFKAGSP